MDDKTKAKLEHAKAIQELVESGYAGVDKFGRIIDRRQYPDAIPMQKNSLLGIPEPRSLEGEK